MSLSNREIMLLMMEGRDNASDEVNRVNNAIRKTGVTAKTSSLALFGYSHAFEQAGRTLTRFGVGVLAIIGYSAKLAVDFERDMRRVNTQAHLTEKQFSNLSKAALATSSKFGISTTEIAEGLYDIFSSVDVNAAQAQKMIRQFSKAAVAGVTDINSVSESAIGLMNAFGLSVEDLGHVLDIQFRLVEKGVGDYTEFASILGMVSPSAVAAGQAIETMAGALAFATRNGLSAAEAGTAVARAMDLITRPKIRNAMRDVLGIDVVDKATGKYKQINQIMTEMATTGGLAKLAEPKRKKVLEEIFGVGEIRAMRFFNIAIPRFKQLNSLMDDTANTGGATQRAFEQMADTLSFKWNVLVQTIRNVGITWGTALFPVLEETVDLLKGVGEWLLRLDPATTATWAKWLLLAGVFSLATGFIFTLIGRIMGLISILRLAGLQFAAVTKVIGGTGLGIFGLIFILANLTGVLDGVGNNVKILVIAFLGFRALMFIPGLLRRIAISAAAMNFGSIANGANILVNSLGALGTKLQTLLANVNSGLIAMSSLGIGFLGALAVAGAGIGGLIKPSKEAGEVLDELDGKLRGLSKTSATTQALRILSEEMKSGAVSAETWKEVIETLPSIGINVTLGQIEAMAFGMSRLAQSGIDVRRELGLGGAAGGVLSFSEKAELANIKLGKVEFTLRKLSNTIDTSLYTALDTTAAKFSGDFIDALSKGRKEGHAFVEETIADIRKWQDELASNINLVIGTFDELATSEDVTFAKLETGVDKALGRMKTFGNNLSRILKAGGEDAEGLVIHLANMGESGVKATGLIASQSKKDIQSFVGDWNKGAGLAQNIAQELSRKIVGALSDIRDILLAIAKKWGISVTLTGDKEVATRIKSLKELVNSIPSVRMIHVGFEGPGAGQQLAAGTSYFKGGLTWLGERGPELGLLPRGSKVYSHSNTIRMLREAMVGAIPTTATPVTPMQAREIHVHVEPRKALVTPEDVYDEFDWGMRTQGW